MPWRPPGHNDCIRVMGVVTVEAAAVRAVRAAAGDGTAANDSELANRWWQCMSRWVSGT